MGVLRESVRRKLAGAVRLPDIEAGVHTPAWLSECQSAHDIFKAAAEKNVEALPLSVFAARPDLYEGLLLGFGALDERELRRGVDVLEAVIVARGVTSRTRSGC
jgi:DNA-binding transcriptional MocR family regulator